MSVLGLHHVSLLCADAQANLDFYVGTLGLRLVKRTVNFDDSGSYHLYYGDGRGTPGTLMTFFPVAELPTGKTGAGAVGRIRLAARPSSVRWWAERLKTESEDDGTLRVADPDGAPIWIVPVERPPLAAAWAGLAVPPEHALGPIDDVWIETGAFAQTRAALEMLGFSMQKDEGGVGTFGVAGGGPVRTVCVERATSRAASGAGTVHHVAFRVADDAELEAWRTRIAAEGYHVTPIKDRDYFRSVYFREPGGTLLELATDGPGFAADERPESLGTSLMLPPFAEPHRTQIESELPPLRLP